MDVDAALQSQIRNIETTYGKALDHWFAVIDASGLTKHNQVVAMLKADHGLAHGAAHRVSLLARQRHDAGIAAPLVVDWAMSCTGPAALTVTRDGPGCRAAAAWGEGSGGRGRPGDRKLRRDASVRLNLHEG
jgi:Domain of unknown function (DUF4287)